MSYSLYRLKKFNIFCINRERIALLGSINTIVFDKTGTLTENFLDISGFIPTLFNTKSKQFEFSIFSSNLKNYFKIIKEYLIIKKDNNSYNSKKKDLLKLYFECLASCHCLSMINNKIIGDPIDVKMFENTDWILEDNQSQDINDINNSNIIFTVKPKKNSELNYKIDVYKRFDFISNLQRMSVIGKVANENYYKIYCKGSPEKLKKLCINETIPENFDETLNYYTAQGYRVLSLACQFISIDDFNKINLIQREKVEKDMIFLGFLIVTNKLKPDSKSTIVTLDKADLRMMMATGDNILTAISVAKECNLLQKNQKIFSLQLEKDENNKHYFVWDKIDNENKNNQGQENAYNNSNKNLSHIEDNNLLSIYPPKDISTIINIEDKEEKEIKENSDNETNIERISKSRRQSVCIDLDNNDEDEVEFIEDNSPLKICPNENFAISITGDTFNKLFELNQKYLILKKDKLLKVHQTFRLVLKNGGVFARMTPLDKSLLVESLKEEGLNPLMCGDGSNDCLALRKANVGISLSVEEASIAAHFTSLHPGINCLIHLLNEGKCSLAASIQVFKFVILESMIQFISVTLVMVNNSYYSDFQFLLEDVGISFPIVSFYLVTDPASKLTHKYPLTGILTFPVLISVIMQMSFVFLFQFFGNFTLQKIFKWEPNCGFYQGTIIPFDCEENTILFILSHFQLITCSIAFFTSKPFRQRIYKKPSQVIYYIVLISYSIWITINCDTYSRQVFMIFDFDSHKNRYKNSNVSASMFKYILFIIVLISSFSSIFYEKFIVKCLEKFWHNNTIKKYKKEINKIAENRLIGLNEEQPIFKYQEVFFYDRRFGIVSGNKGALNKKVDGINFIELVGTNDSDNGNNVTNIINDINDINDKETNIDNK